ncbi:MAG: hypothetical protein ABI639_02995 [Thermoanaerobaculia bacterium]
MNQRYRCLAASALLLSVAGITSALTVPQASPLADKEVRLAGLATEPSLKSVSELESAVAGRLSDDLARLGLDSRYAFIDARGGQWATLWLSAPLIPGDGVGNDLTWAALGESQAPAKSELGLSAWNGLVRYLDAHRAELRIPAEELTPRTSVDESGDFIQIRGLRQVNGVPVRGSSLVATVSHGNLILLGAEQWGKIDVSTEPSISASEAMNLLVAHLEAFTPSGYSAKPHLELLPVGVDGAPGHGYTHRLAWIVEPQFAGRNESYEAAIDAHSGEVLFFQDMNSYATRNINGGVLPASNDGQVPDGVEQPGYPMPFATVTHTSGTANADSGGNIFGVTGNMTTQLVGPYIKIVDNCGAVNQSSASGDLELGVSAGTDCAIPSGASAGDTHASRTGYYELNRIKEMARGQWSAGPASTWLNAQLTSNMNINLTCNAFWSNTNFTVNFYRSGGGCFNTGELAGVFDHEWGHGLDFNGTANGVSTPGEGIADVYAALRLDNSCVGRGFTTDLCGGYGDPCTVASGCTGIRDIDWAHRTSAIPHTLTWANGNAQCPSSNVHCRGALYAEAIWDLAKRDLPLLGMDANTAIEVATRIAFMGADNVTTWFGTTVGTAGCAATSGYQQLLGADDDNGSLADGTPHMTSIANAFNRHEIGCATPAVTVSGCAGGPTAAVTATISPNDTAADISWPAVPNATRYKIYRTEGEFGCNFGKAMVGTTSSLFFHDAGLKNGRLYSYVVAPFGASDACMGAASSCLNVTPSAGLGAANSAVSICTGTDAVYSLTVTPPFVSPVTLGVSGNPAGSTTNLSPNPVVGTLPAVSTLTIGNTAAVAAGDYPITVNGNDGSTSFNLVLQLTAYAASPGAPSLTAPGAGATNVPLATSFTWAAQTGVASYELQVATDNAFANVIRTATTATTSTTVSPDLPSNVELFWRVRGINTCGNGGYSAARSFSTVALPGDCGLGTSAASLYDYGFETGANGWTSSGTGNSWAQSALNPHSGTASWRASSPSIVSDQRLVSPAIILPASGSGLTLQYWSAQEMEHNGTTGCFDGAILEASTDGGATFTQIVGANLLTDPYDGPVSTQFTSPIGGLQAWCGDPQPLTRSVVNISAFAGQTVQFGFRFASDSSVNRPNGAWFIDDVKVQNCVAVPVTIFHGDFETGNTSLWSVTVP